MQNVCSKNWWKNIIWDLDTTKFGRNFHNKSWLNLLGCPCGWFNQVVGQHFHHFQANFFQHCELACGHRPFFFFNLTWYDIYRVGWLLKSLTGKFLLRYSTFWTRKRQFFTNKFKIIDKCQVNSKKAQKWLITQKYWMVWYSDQQWGEFKEGQRK